MKATGTPTSHGEIMNTQHQHSHTQPNHLHTDDNDLLTLDEAAAILRTPKATLRYWRHLGTGPASFRLGRRVLYRAADLHTFIDTQRRQDGHEAA
jgi:hypothetical protein